MLPESHLTLEADLRLAFRLVVASLFAALIGWERETKNKPAGLRTHMLVGVSAALFVSLGEVMIVKYRAEGLLMRLDMINILAAVVSGVSFLGAGMIFRARGKDIHGLTTAASVGDGRTRAVSACWVCHAPAVYYSARAGLAREGARFG
jgi:uncharacterized membrane protein YhiD involved in acid resistance